MGALSSRYDQPRQRGGTTRFDSQGKRIRGEFNEFDEPMGADVNHRSSLTPQSDWEGMFGPKPSLIGGNPAPARTSAAVGGISPATAHDDMTPSVTKPSLMPSMSHGAAANAAVARSMVPRSINSPESRQDSAILASPAPVTPSTAANQTGNAIDYNAIAERRALAQQRSGPPSLITGRQISNASGVAQGLDPMVNPALAVAGTGVVAQTPYGPVSSNPAPTIGPRPPSLIAPTPAVAPPTGASSLIARPTPTAPPVAPVAAGPQAPKLIQAPNGAQVDPSDFAQAKQLSLGQQFSTMADRVHPTFTKPSLVPQGPYFNTTGMGDALMKGNLSAATAHAGDIGSSMIEKAGGLVHRGLSAMALPGSPLAAFTGTEPPSLLPRAKPVDLTAPKPPQIAQMGSLVPQPKKRIGAIGQPGVQLGQ